MNDKTTELLEKLAAKLGTTTEYLWGVLLSQAHVDAIKSLIFMAIELTFILLFVRFCKQSHKAYNEDDFNNEWRAPILIIWGLTCSAVFFGFCFEIDHVIDGFFNPEYWALNKVLNLIK